MVPTRETFGNIPHGSVVLFYCLTVVTLVVFGWGVWRRFRLWRQGVPIAVRELLTGSLSQVWNQLKPGLRRLLAEGLGQARVRGRGLPSWAHICLFAGFMVLFLGTTLLEIDHLASAVSRSLHFHKGTYYVIYEFTLDVLGLLFLAACSVFLWRRTRRPPSLGHRGTDWYVVLSFLAIGLTGYLVEGLRMVWQHPTGVGVHCSPVGWLISGWFAGMTESSARSTHLTVWWLHTALAFGFIASIPYTRLFHTVAGPLNLFFRNLGPPRRCCRSRPSRAGRRDQDRGQPRDGRLRFGRSLRRRQLRGLGTLLPRAHDGSGRRPEAGVRRLHRRLVHHLPGQ